MQRPRGTRDFGPDEMAAREAVGAQMRGVFRRFGYREVQTPTFEELELFTAKSGEGIKAELYDFKDKGDRALTLRPELTAPVMRMYYESHFNDPKPIKWFYFGACYRYDRPQAGRYREFWQFGCEQIGAGTPLAYAELIALADATMREAGVKSREFFVGHVKILQALLDQWKFKSSEQRKEALRLIDKQDFHGGSLKAILEQCEDFTDAKADQFIEFLTHTSSTFHQALSLLADLYRVLGDPNNPILRAIEELEQVFAHLKSFGVENVKLNLGIARGLDYYTGIVFEMHCPLLGAEKQLLGGGGYDLSGVFGGQPTPTMGFGLGFDRTLVALEKEGAQLPKSEGPVVYLAALGEKAQQFVAGTAAALRRAGVAVDIDLLGRKPASAAKHADAVGARHLVVVGDRDLEAGTVQVKELATGKVESVGLNELPAWFVA
ncbi:MAG TPA: histidine--tRNA ligase [Candidatus Thermoplasmatota archaeon]|nr:histidine--tRNA ligase [Candidatus Thermoplasmatota archaeon]